MSVLKAATENHPPSQETEIQHVATCRARALILEMSIDFSLCDMLAVVNYQQTQAEMLWHVKTSIWLLKRCACVHRADGVGGEEGRRGAGLSCALTRFQSHLLKH